MPFLPDLDMEYDPDGNKEQVAVVMKGQTYRDAGLKKSEYPNIEGPLYDKLCQFPRHKVRDDVRKLAQNIAIAANEKNFKPTVEWLDNFMRRFCISRKKMGFYSSKMLKIKGGRGAPKVGIPPSLLTASTEEDSGILSALGIPDIDPSNNLKEGNDSDAGSSNSTKNISNSNNINGNSTKTTLSSSQDSESSKKTIPFSTLSIHELSMKTKELGDGNCKENKVNEEKGIENKMENGIKMEVDDSDSESIKELPREKSPEREVINLDSDSEEDSLKKKKSMIDKEKVKNENVIEMKIDENERHDKECESEKNKLANVPENARNDENVVHNASDKDNGQKNQESDKEKPQEKCESDESTAQEKCESSKDQEKSIRAEDKLLEGHGSDKDAQSKKNQMDKTQEKHSSPNENQDKALSPDKDQENQGNDKMNSQKKQESEKDNSLNNCENEKDKSEEESDNNEDTEKCGSDMNKEQKNHEKDKEDAHDENDDKHESEDVENEVDNEDKQGNEDEMKGEKENEENLKIDSAEEKSNLTSGSDSENSEHDSDLVVKSKSWEERNFVKYSKTEDAFYKENEASLKRKLEEKLTNCTACFEQVNHNIKADIFTHNVLGVLMCKKCYKFYGKGKFQKDSDGYDEYCRWCANGGDLLLCDQCTNGFCKKCVKRNLGRNAEATAKKSKSWKCYVCDVQPLTEVRALHRTALDQIRGLSILQKSFSRRERREFQIKQKFAALKMKRKDQGLDTESGLKEKNSEDLNSDEVMKDVRDICITCIDHVDAIKKRKAKGNDENTESKAMRRLWKLADAMEQNFAKVKASLEELAGSSIEESSPEKSINKKHNKNVGNKDIKKDETKSPRKIESSGRSEKRKRDENDSDNDNEAPAKQTIMETDSEGLEGEDVGDISMHEEASEVDKVAELESSKEDKNDELESLKSSEKVRSKISHSKKDNSSNEDSDIDNAAFDDAASSKNPDGESENDANMSKESEEDEETKDKKVEDELVAKSSSTSSVTFKDQSQANSSSSDTEMSQSLLKSLDAEKADEKGEKETAVPTKKGILLRSRKLKKKDDNDKDKSSESDDDEKPKKKKKKKLESKGLEKLLISDSSEDDNKEDKKVKMKKKEMGEDSDSDDKTVKKILKKSKKVTICEDSEKEEKENDSEEEKEKDSEEEKEKDSEEEKKESRKIKKSEKQSNSVDSKMKNGLKSLIDSDSESEDDDDVDNLLADCSKMIKDSKTLTKKSGRRRRRIKYKPKPKSIQKALKKKQLKSKVAVKVEKLDKKVVSRLDENGFICVDEFPQFHPDDMDLMSDSDSDKELEAILKIKATKAIGLGLESENDADSESEEEVEDKKSKKEKKNSEESKKRKKKEGLCDINIDKEENEEDGEEGEEEEDATKKFDTKSMKALLLSSEDEQDDEEEEEEEDKNDLEKLTEEEIEKKKKEIYDKNKKKEKETKKDSEDSDNEEITKKVKKKGFLSFKFSSSEDEEDEDDDSEKESPRKSRMFIESDSDFELTKKKKKKGDLFSSSDDDDDSDSGSSSSDEKSKKDKKSKSRKRIKRPSSSTEEEGGEEGEEGEEGNDKETPSKKRRRHIIRDEDLLQSTKDATQEEKERRERVRERQLKYNKIMEIDVETDQKDQKKLVLDFNEETKEEVVVVNEKLVSYLKPHQVSGIRFMWDATVENVERLQKGEKGGGSILAHCMGLGKTLQVIAYIHTLLTNKKTNRTISRVMVCCPVNTVYNWVAEFKSWLRGKLDVFDVVELISSKDLWARAYKLDDWYKEGGVCIIGYDMFRNLSNANNKRYKGAMKEKFQKCLVTPGPDLMVCDEGHILKNEKTALSIAINKIKTARRVVLTGTPLQNNLKEYHCMIQFVKPNLLGSKKEFMNRFVNPIEAGQCVDAMPRDVKRMKRRAHILHNLLEGCVQRFDYSVLKPFLPPKYEYVISVQMCDVQCKLYDYYLKNLAQGGPKRTGSGLFVDFNNLSRIWSHPVVLYLALRRRELKGEELDDEEELDGFIDDSESSNYSSDDDKPKKKKKKKNEDTDDKSSEEDKKEDEVKIVEEDKVEEVITPGLTSEGKVRPDWWRRVMEEMGDDNYDEDDFLNRVEISGKLYLLFDILRESCSIGDKVLLFSQSILGLDMIEEFLRMWDAGEIKFPPNEVEVDKSMPQPYTHWKPEKDYYRLDGSTSADIRRNQCKSFNNTSNERCRLFLISTRAGGVGINLVGANRVIIFDSSWNPSHDTQSIFRVYRFGQKKPCYIYRFVAQGTMEEKIYSRQVTKISTSLRVVDEHQIKRYFNMAELSELYQFTPESIENRETPSVPEDRLLAELLIRNKNWIVKYHEQDSLLENQTGEELSEEERNAAWEDYENEKKGVVPQRQFQNPSFNIPQNVAKFDIQQIHRTIVKSNPGANTAQIYDSLYLATQQIQKVHLSQYQSIQGLLYNLKNPMIAPEILRTMQIQDPNELIQHLDIQLRNLEENIRAETKALNQISSVSQSSISHNSMVSAGLARGNPVPGAVSSTAQYVNRNFPATSLVNTNFKKVIIPPKKMSDASTSSSGMSDPLKITSNKESSDPAEVVTLE